MVTSSDSKPDRGCVPDNLFMTVAIRYGSWAEPNRRWKIDQLTSSRSFYWKIVEISEQYNSCSLMIVSRLYIDVETSL